MSGNPTLTDPNPASHVAAIAGELKLRPAQVAATARLIAEGGTVPFIARYRKEATGELDEVAVAAIRDRLEQLAALDSRRQAIVKSLEERALLTPGLAAKLAAAGTLAVLEDLFQPFRPKRRTRATIARERGLEPLADWLDANQDDPAADPQAAAAAYLAPDHEVPDAAAALAGARDILAERISDDATARAAIRRLTLAEGVVTSKVMFGRETDPEAQKFRDYFDWSEPLAGIPSHRLLAIRRGEKEGWLMLRITAPESAAHNLLEPLFARAATPCAEQLRLAVHDSYKRLLGPSLETEARLESKRRADAEAVRVFAANLRELLLAAPLGRRRVLGIDPGLRTGCKVVCLDAQGKLLHYDVLHLAGGGGSPAAAAAGLLELVRRFAIEAVAIGNGTGGREAEALVRRCGLPPGVAIVQVNESGASIYSASDVAREEFPDHDLTVRGAVSIGRRLMDPLAELVKLDPKSIGVGQYQHDVDQHQLKQGLDDVVVSCVNGVGVEVNTASKQLLSYVSGLNSTLAANLVAWRDEHGPFRSRRQLREVPRMGDKTFEQAAGFLRVRDGEHPLDASAVHPERYPLVERMAADLGCTVADLLERPEQRARIDLRRYVDGEVGLPTLQDILAELARPGRDPREGFEAFAFAADVAKPADLKPGMKLPGIVTNVTNFGAFVDVGVHQDGLVHVSQLADHFVRDPAEVVKVGQRVTATVLEVDLARKRIALSLKAAPEPERRPPAGAPGESPSRPGGPRGGPPRPRARPARAARPREQRLVQPGGGARPQVMLACRPPHRPPAMTRPGLILKLRCPDRPGIVARVAQHIAAVNGNLLELSQFTDREAGRFFARLEIDTAALEVEADDFIAGFGTLGRALEADWHFRKLPYRMRTAVLVTRVDHCLNEILWRAGLGEMPVEITSVIANRDDCRARAEGAGLPFHLVEMDGPARAGGFRRIRDLLAAEQVELVVLARFMQIVPDWFCSEFAGRVINIHHSFLPAFVGANPYRQAYERGVKLIGATCHYVTTDLDAGPIIEQTVERVQHYHTVQDLARLGRDCERAALARGIRYHVNDRTLLDGNRAIVFPD
jgi:protein Tex